MAIKILGGMAQTTRLCVNFFLCLEKIFWSQNFFYFFLMCLCRLPDILPLRKVFFRLLRNPADEYDPY